MKKEKKKRLRRLAERKDRRHSIRDARRPTFTGRITVTASGVGFVTPEPGENGETSPDIFIPPQFLHGALDGDKVLVRLLPERPEDAGEERGPAGRVEEILEEKRQSVVGELLAGRVVRPLSKRLHGDLELTGPLRGAQRGDWVKLKLIRGEEEEGHRGKILSTLGRAGSVKGDLDAVCAEFDLQPPYTPEEEEAAMQLEIRPMEREDLRRRFTVTIDPIDAKDFDDAVSVAPGKETGWVEIGVHIADVAAFIAPRSPFDKAAAKRAFTAYLPGRTLPMLPRALTAKLSLHTGEDCPAHSVLLQVDKKTGQVMEFRRCHSLVRINRRLDYEVVQRVLDGEPAPEDWPKTLLTGVRKLAAVTGAMRRYRMKTEEFIDLAMPEIRVLCDENADEVKGLARKIQRESEFLVEECMLAANSAVGAELGQIGVAGLYRVHPEPDPEKLEEFNQTVSESFGLHPGDLSNRRLCRQFIESLPDDPRRPVILSQLLRSMPRAYYSEKPVLHFGLGKNRYCHFTSPIRRYPDLLVHQQLWNYDLKQRTRSGAALAAVAADCSAREENNDNAYFAATDRLKLRYLAEQLEKTGENFYEGVIAKVTSGGLLADIPAIGIYGFIPRENLGGNFSRRDGKLTDPQGRRQYRCGDFVYLKLSQIDPVRGAAEFKPVSR